MNRQIVESRHGHDDELVYTPRNLGPAIGMSGFSVVRLMSQEPSQLPPAIILSKPGAKKQKRVWLKTSVARWLEERQESGEKQSLLSTNLPVEQSLKATAAPVRGRGRPRKILQGGAV